MPQIPLNENLPKMYKHSKRKSGYVMGPKIYTFESNERVQVQIYKSSEEEINSVKRKLWVLRNKLKWSLNYYKTPWVTPIIFHPPSDSLHWTSRMSTSRVTLVVILKSSHFIRLPMIITKPAPLINIFLRLTLYQLVLTLPYPSTSITPKFLSHL